MGGVFDYVFSYAALYHLSKADQCDTGIQLIQKLRVGGKAWWGWNQDYSMTHWEWRHCLLSPDSIVDMPADVKASAKSFQIEFEAFEDAFIYAPSSKTADENYLYQYPAYTIFITRLA